MKLQHGVMGLVLFVLAGCATYGPVSPGYPSEPYQQQRVVPRGALPAPGSADVRQPWEERPEVQDGYLVRPITLIGEQDSISLLAQLFEMYIRNARLHLINHPQPRGGIIVKGPSGEALLDFTADEFDTILKIVDVYQQHGNVQDHFPQDWLEYRSGPGGKKQARVDLKKVIPRQVQMLNSVIGPLQQADSRKPQSAPHPQSPQPVSSEGSFEVIQAYDPRMTNPYPASRIINGRSQVIIFNGVADPGLLAQAKQRAAYLAEVAGRFTKGESWYHLHTPASPRGALPAGR